MKQTLLTTALLITTVLAFAQAPQGINYQAVVRDAGGNELVNQAVSLRMTILENNTTTVYQETHSATTNGFGLVNLVIGQGAATQGTFNTIDWSTGNYFAQIEVDVSWRYKLLSNGLSAAYERALCFVCGEFRLGW
jgi:hypothetical protein